jgi:hypothetical protein
MKKILLTILILLFASVSWGVEITQENSYDPASIVATGSIYINDTSNAKSTIGLTINQSTNDDEVVSLKSSDVEHGLTNITETDTYGLIKKYSADYGGLRVEGVSDGDDRGLVLYGTMGTTDPGDTTPAIYLSARKSNGTTSVAALGAAETCTLFTNYTTSLFAILGNANLQIGGIATPNGNLAGGAIWKGGTAASAAVTDATQMWTSDYLGTGGDNRLFIMGEGSASYKTAIGSGKVSHQGTTGGMTRQVVEATANIEGGASTTIAVNVPSGARILGCQLRVDTALTATELWDAAYAGGATQAIVSGAAVAQNTKVNAMFNTNGATDITSDVTTIAITKNGGGNFTAAGTIRAIVYYEAFDTMASL